MTLRILLADDQELVRTGLRTLCERERDITVIAEAADGHQAVALARTHRPEVVLMDLRMPGMDGITATRRILSDARDATNPVVRDPVATNPVPANGVRVLVLTTYGLEQNLFEALRAGASGFLTKDVDPVELRQAIRTVAAGDALLAPEGTRAQIEAFITRSPKEPDARRLKVLTVREREVLTLVGRGLSNIEIGRQLFLSPATVKTHVNRSRAKLGVRDRAQLVVIAYESGLVKPGEASGPGEIRSKGFP